jgi:predicted dehydrogenase
MRFPVSRREFLKQAGLVAGALPTLGMQAEAVQAKDKLRCVVIGCGGRGQSHLDRAVNENLVAIVDPDDTRLDNVGKFLQKKSLDPTKVQRFNDYRQMFDKMANQIDVVFVATPNHHHALPTMMAMAHGKSVYCEKPLCHTVDEARKLAKMQSRSKVATMMGNQGHCEEGYRRLCEYIWSGAIGNITETHSWTDRANGGFGPRPVAETPPATMHWDAWIGPAPFREFHKDLHPHEWHGWVDFGNGSLGNMGCHVLDGVFWACKVEHPTSIEAEVMYGGGGERYPTGSRLRWDIPARGSMPAMKAYWYDGREGNGDPGDGNKGTVATAPKGPHYLPPLLKDLMKQYPDEGWDLGGGTLYVGDKGIMYTSTYGGGPGSKGMRIVPFAKMEAYTPPEKTLPRVRDSFTEFLSAAREGRSDTPTPFSYGARLTEFVILGNMGHYAGVGNKVEWDGPNMRVTNLKDLNKFVKHEYRSGWHV